MASSEDTGRTTKTILTTTASAISPAEDSSENEGYLAKVKGLLGKVKAAPLALALGTFLLGYKFGAGSAASSAASEVANVSVRSTARRYPLFAVTLLAVAVRDIWMTIPDWAKKNIPVVSPGGQHTCWPGMATQSEGEAEISGVVSVGAGTAAESVGEIVGGSVDTSALVGGESVASSVGS